MNIKFLDATTVVVTESLDWVATRPKNKIQKKQSDIVEEFIAQHSNYLVESIEGAEKISNFRGEEQSKGSWTLKVKNTRARKKDVASRKPTDKKTTLKKEV